MNANSAPLINVALLGYGFGGKTFHAPLIASVPQMQLTHVVSSDPEKVHKDWPRVTVLATAAQAFANPDISLIVVATPNHTHFRLARQALQAGKHVVVDKPFTTNEAEAIELAAEAKRAGKLISVYQNRRWDGDFLTLRNVINDGMLGEIVQFDSHFDRYRPQLRANWKEQPQPGSGLWFDLGPHLIDQSLQLFGFPQAIYADFSMQREGTRMTDYFHVLLRYSTLRVVLHASALIAGTTLRFSVHGRTGSFVKYGLDTQEAALIRGERPNGPAWDRDPKSGTLTLVHGAGEEPKVLPNFPGNYLAYYQAIRDAILNGASNPVPPEDGIAVMRVLDFGVRSALEKREVAFTEE